MVASSPMTTLPITPPMAPSTVLLGLTTGASLCLPNARPAKIITAVVGLAVLAVVLAFFDTILFDLVLAAICLLAIHEVFTAMGFGKKQWYLYAAAVPFTMLLMLSSSGAARAGQEQPARLRR